MELKDKEEQDIQEMERDKLLLIMKCYVNALSLKKTDSEAYKSFYRVLDKEYERGEIPYNMYYWLKQRQEKIE